MSDFIQRWGTLDGGRRVSPRFHLFVSNLNQGNEELGSKFLCVTPGMERTFLDLLQAAKN